MKPNSDSIKEIFAQALQKQTPAERELYLAGACAGRPEVREQVESLLQAHDEAGGFLDKTMVLPATAFGAEQAGAKIGRYKLLELIGEGGFGSVWMAEQEEPVRRRVALKVVKLGMDTKQVLARFESERQALAMMDHPSIARVFDGGATEAGRPYFVMELVRGTRITDYCDANKLSTRERLRLFIQVCQAVQHAHQKGVIHRDLKPSNILVTEVDGEPVPKVIDFGVAKATQARLTELTLFTGLHQMIGTPAYMSPEQAGLGALDMDTRSDIYALGVLLYELLTGETPLTQKHLEKAGLDEILRLIREQDPPKPSTRLSGLTREQLTAVAAQRQAEPVKLNRLLSGDLDWIVMKALEKNRRRRYETANGLALDIERHLQNEPVTACPPGNWYRFQKMVRRNKLAFGAATAVAVSLILGLGISSFLFVREKEARANAAGMFVREKEARRLAEDAKKQAQAETARAEAASREAKSAEAKAKEKETEAKTALSGSEFLQGSHAIAEGRRGDALAYLARSFSDNPSNEAALTSMTALLASHSWMAPTVLLKPATAAQFSPDGNRIVTAADDGIVRVWDARTGRQQLMFVATENGVPPGGLLQNIVSAVKPGHKLNSAQFSPDGRRIVTAAWDQARVWDAQNGQPLTEPLQHNGSVTSAQFTPDGSRIVTVCGPAVWIWEAQTGRQLMLLTNEFEEINSAHFSPDGKRLVANSQFEARVWEMESGRLLADVIYRGFSSILNSARFSPDGRRIITASDSGVSQVWDAQTGLAAGAPWQHLSSVVSAQFSPDGKSIVTATVGGAISICDAETGKTLPGLPGQNDRPNVVEFSPDGTQLLTAAGATVRLWDAQTRKPLTEPLPHRSMVRSAQFSPDGKRLLTSSGDGIAQVWDWQNSQPAMTTLLPHSSGVSSAQFSPDGSLIVTASETAARIWDAQTGQPLTNPLKHGSTITSVQFSPDSRRIVTGSLDKTAQMWDAKSGDRLAKPMEHPAAVYSAQFSPDGKRVVTATADGSAWEWDVQSGQSLPAEPMKHGGWLASAQFSPDGQRIVTASQDGTAGVWDAQTGRSLFRLTRATFDPFNAAEFSADSLRILTVSKDGSALVWDARSGAQLTRLGGAMTMAKFSPDGKRIVTASAATVRVWDAQSGQPVTEPMQHHGAVNSAQFSPDGTRIVTTETGAAQIWDALTGQKLVEELHHGRDARPGEFAHGDEGVRVAGILWGVNSAEFSPDGKRVVTTADDGNARVWDIGPSHGKPGDWLPQLAEAISGQAVNQKGLLEPTRLNAADVISQIRQQLNLEPDDDDWVVWGRWFLADPTTRTISPFAKATIPELIADRIKVGTEESLNEAGRLAGDNAGLLQHVAEGRRILAEAARRKEAAQVAKEKDIEVRLADVGNLLDVVVPGNWETETNHASKGDMNELGVTVEFHQTNFEAGPTAGYRQTNYHRGATEGGWFSYEVKVLPDKPAVAICAYLNVTNSLQNFDILANGQKIATEAFTTNNNRPAGFFNMEYPIPTEITDGSEHVTLKFRARPNKSTGQLTGLHILKAAQ